MACEKAGISHQVNARADAMAERYADLDLDRPSETFLGVSELAAGLVWAAPSVRRFLST
jgi:hypothetical protein